MQALTQILVQRISTRTNRLTPPPKIKIQRFSNKAAPEQKPVAVGKRLAIVGGLLVVWGGIYYYSTKKKAHNKIVTRDEQLSKVDIGREDFNLIDHDGNPVTKKSFTGKWLLLYFGFTHCPDICPEELERMSEIVDIIDADESLPNLVPLFLTVDPDRDTAPIIKEYVKEYSKKFIGLTGTKEEIKNATKTYRVYFSAGPKDEDGDYILDHTIVMYLMSPKGNFVDYYGSRSTKRQDVVNSITKNMQNYIKLHGRD